MNLVEKIKILNNYLKTKNFNKVIEDGKKILKKSPKNDYLLNLIGMAFQGKSQYLNSIKFFHLGPENKWQDNLKQNFVKKIEKNFYTEMKELNYL